MVLPELLVNFIESYPKTISVLLEISKTHYNVITGYIDHLIFVCNKEKNENIEKLLRFFMNHDIVYGFANLVGSTEYQLNIYDVEYSCYWNSHRILSFLFKYKNYYFVYLEKTKHTRLPEHTVLLLFIENFTKNGLTNRLNKLIIGDEHRDAMLTSLFYALEILNFKAIENFKIYDIVETLLFNYANHYNLNGTDLWNNAHKNIFNKVANLLVD